MKLHYQIFGEGQPLVILHGLFGSSDNWRSLAKQLSASAQVITVDLRNHGQSPHSTEQNYQLMADDLAELLVDLKLTSVNLLGHSIGGKVAMEFSQRYSDLVNKQLIVDISPKQYQAEHHAIFDALLAIDLTMMSRRNEVDESLSEALPNKAVRQFLLMNLENKNNQLRWKINIQALADNYSSLLMMVCSGERGTAQPTLFIRGGRSNYILDGDYSLIHQKFRNVEIRTIEQAGHWVHAEAPTEFLNEVNEFFEL